MNRLLYLSLALAAAPLHALVPELITKYKELVDTKETNKIVESKHPIKLLSYDILYKWKWAANLLSTDVTTDQIFELQKATGLNDSLFSYAEDLRKEVTKLYDQCTIIIQQAPAALYKKPLIGKAKYSSDQQNQAKSKIRETLSELKKINTQGFFRIRAGIEDIIKNLDLKKVTEGSRKIYTYALDFAKKMETITTHLITEINKL